MKNVTLEYVLSGSSYMRMNHGQFISSPTCIQKFKDMLAIVQKASSHDISVLFNAFVESDYGEKYRRTGIDKNFKRVYTDSGGLQLITRGLSIDQKTKDSIYSVQQKYSQVAMCFDEIPVGVIGKTSKRNDYEFRYFDRDLLKEKSRLTGININEQINYFKSKSTDGTIPSPVVIVHGQDYDSYLTWSDGILKAMDKENYQYLNCVAISSAAGGSGPIEEIRKYFLLKHLPFEKIDHFHILGVGSVRRLSPLLLMIRKGLFDNMNVSYDSTTHSSSSVMGQFYNRAGKKAQLGRYMNENYREIYEEIKEVFDLDYSLEEFFKSLTTSITGYSADHGTGEHVVTSSQLIGLTSIYNFVKEIDYFLNNHDDLLNLFNKDVTLYNYLYESVNNLDDYFAWEREASKHLKSLTISDGKKETVDDLFV